MSDARNAGMEHVKGDYVLYLDSDDFIHPQTLELTYKAANENNADMVTFNHDVDFHNYLKKKISCGYDVTDEMPKIKNYKKISAQKVENIIFHTTEKNRTLHVKRPVRRHCYSVLALYRNDLIKKIPFIKGIIIEDFPWWVSVLLKRPKTVMLNLPLYFYIPNVSSLSYSAKSLFMARSVSYGLKASYALYKQYATEKEFKHFNREFLWPFTITLMRKVRELDNDKDRKSAAVFVKELYDIGVFNTPVNMQTRKYKRRIEGFIK